MCNRYGLTLPIRELEDSLQRLELPIADPPPERLPNFEPREHIRPTDVAPILRPIDGGLQLVERRWGQTPWFHKKGLKEWKPLTTNCRGETASTTATFRGAFERRRCLVPATHFFEWTGPKGAKVMWRFHRTEQSWFAFAGLWDRAELPDGPLESFTIITSAPGPDAANYHDRQPVIVEPADFQTWLDPSQPADALLRPPDAGGVLTIIEEAKVQAVRLHKAGPGLPEPGRRSDHVAGRLT